MKNAIKTLLIITMALTVFVAFLALLAYLAGEGPWHLSTNIKAANECEAQGYTPIYGPVSDTVKCDVTQKKHGNVTLRIQPGHYVMICTRGPAPYPDSCYRAFPKE